MKKGLPRRDKQAWRDMSGRAKSPAPFVCLVVVGVFKHLRVAGRRPRPALPVGDQFLNAVVGQVESDGLPMELFGHAGEALAAARNDGVGHVAFARHGDGQRRQHT